MKYGDNFVVDSTKGKIAGFTITTVDEPTLHAYANTLYTQVIDSNSNIYEAGIRGSSTTNDPSNAAFYVRKKTSSMTKWSEAEYSFVVKKNGNTLCTNLTIGDSLNMLAQSDYGDESKKIKAISTNAYSTQFGYISGNNSSYMAAWKDGSNQGILSFHIDGSQALNMQRLGSGINSYFAFYPCNCTADLGTKSDTFSTLYVDAIYLTGDKKTYTSLKGINSGDDGDTTNTKLYKNTIRIGSSGHGDKPPGGGTDYEVYSPTEWNVQSSSNNPIGYLPITCSSIGAVPTTTVDASRNVSSSISNTLHMANGSGWDLVSTNSKEVTGIYCNSSNQVMMGDTGYKTVLRGSSIMFKGVSDVSSNSSYTNFLVMDTNGNLGWKTSTGGSVSLKIDGTTRSSSLTDYDLATRDWVKGAFGNTLSISNNTLTLKNYNGSALSSVTLPTNSGGGNSFSKSSIDTLYSQSSSGYYVSIRDEGTAKTLAPSNDEKTRLGCAGYKWKSIHCYTASIDTSDEHLKTNLKSISNIEAIDNIYMDLNPIVYQFKNFDSEDDHDRYHFGFGARETEKIFSMHNLDATNYGVLCKDTLDRPNKAGDLIEYAFRYGEFVALNTHMTQKAHHRIDSLEEQNTSLKSENQSLKNEILMLQGQLSLITQRLQKMEEKLC